MKSIKEKIVKKFKNFSEVKTLKIKFKIVKARLKK